MDAKWGIGEDSFEELEPRSMCLIQKELIQFKFHNKITYSLTKNNYVPDKLPSM